MTLSGPRGCAAECEEICPLIAVVGNVDKAAESGSRVRTGWSEVEGENI